MQIIDDGVGRVRDHNRPKLRWRVLGWTPLLAFLVSCGGGGGADLPGPTEPAGLSATAQLGQKIFNDVSLSASGKQSCASCHVATAGLAQSNDLPAQLGGPLMNLQGQRISPSIRYLSTNTAFFFAADGTPTGGFFWDGRAASLQEQAGQPFLNPVEMANESKADVVALLAKTPYASEFKAQFGSGIFSDVDSAFQRITIALQQYQLEDSDFKPFSSKYDAFLRGKAQLSAQEMRGLVLFNNPTKANCVACHPSGMGANGAMPLFTDFTFDRLGVPRNPALSQNDDPQYYDMGLCARAGDDLIARKDLCGLFKVPSLRNAALRKAFFHNGYFKNLKDVVTFYVQRDTNPEKWYPKTADRSFDKFNDLPPEWRRNVNVLEVPYNRTVGQAPALDDAEIDDVVAFLQTLTDGFDR